jgi:predicted CxxxxCH...CXXCH cytochrome family protein
MKAKSKGSVSALVSVIMTFIAGLLSIAAFTVETTEASFLNSCTIYCHGMPPRDAARKANPHFDSQSSAFLGNHRGHLSPTPVASACTVCHIPVAATAFGHQNGVINMANSLKGYSSSTIRASYDKGTFFNQTSIPNLINATCSNVSCHFETKTPAWNSPVYTFPASCNICHGLPPAGTPSAPSGGLAGSHARHNAYFPGATGCQKCHPGYTGFTHASSAGRALRVQGYLRDPLNLLEAGATYSGSGTNYLPSQSSGQLFGSCSNLYCHSTGQSSTGAGIGTSVTTPNWGSGALTCGNCHQNMGPATNNNATGKHIRHAQTAGISCAVCHGAAYGSTTVPTGAGTTHVDKNINLAWTGLAAAPVTTYSKGNSFAAGSSAYGVCSNSYCHSTVQNAANGTNSGITYRTGISWNPVATVNCGSCHVDEAADLTGTGSHRAHVSASGANLGCVRCHLGYTSTATAPATHVNGLIELGAAGISYSQGSGISNPAGNGYGSCSSVVCHGSGIVPWGGTLWSATDQCGKCHSSSAAGAVTASAPFYNTSYPVQIISNLDVKTGAHTAHITSSESLHPGLACIDCHGTVNLNDATHMNGVTNFNWSVLARTGNLSPSYNPSTGMCTNVYCHGNAMPGGDTSGTDKTPVWNNPTYLPPTLSVAGCKICHGFPPAISAGHPPISIPAGFPATAPIGTTCNCHGNVNPAGNSYANIFVDKAQHINGTLEGGKCNSCHGYPPASAGFAGSLNNWTGAKVEDYTGGGGAHTINSHVTRTARPEDGFAYCIKCHSPADHMTSPVVYNPMLHIKVNINNRYRLEAAKQVRYTSNRLLNGLHLTGTCSNISCHYGATPKWDLNH